MSRDDRCRHVISFHWACGLQKPECWLCTPYLHSPCSPVMLPLTALLMASRCGKPFRTWTPSLKTNTKQTPPLPQGISVGCSHSHQKELDSPIMLCQEPWIRLDCFFELPLPPTHLLLSKPNIFIGIYCSNLCLCFGSVQTWMYSSEAGYAEHRFHSYLLIT